MLTVLPRLTNRRDEPIRCQLEHVSLEEFTDEYKTWAQKSGSDLKLQPHKTRLAWIEYKSLNRPASEKDEEQCSARPNNACRYTWGDYVALSYTWGSSEKEYIRQIVLNGRFFDVTENLNAALHLARISDNLTTVNIGSAKLWVDAICIEQTNDREKKRELRRMKNIYGGSMGVFVHLGPEEHDGNHGIEILQQIASEVQDCIDRDQYPKLEHRMQMDDANRKDLSALINLLSRPYWCRLWILQELAMSDETSVIGYGQRKILFGEVVLACKFIWHNLEKIMIACGYITTVSAEGFITLNSCMWVILFIQYLRELSQRLEDAQGVNYGHLQIALNLSQNGQAKYANDKVFGLLAILPDGIGARMEQYHDYPTEEVFIEFSKAIIGATENLDVIFMKSRTQKMTPSWATDWQLSPDRVSLLHDWHIYGYKRFDQAYENLEEMIETARQSRADGSWESGFGFLENSSVLQCSGIKIGTVDGVATAMGGFGEFNYTLEEPIQPESQPNPYGDEVATRRALVHTLFANPIWGDKQEAALFQIPWITERPYPSTLTLQFSRDEGWQQTALRLQNELGWEFMLRYGNFYSFEMFRMALGPFQLAGRPFHDYFDGEVAECTIPHDRVYLDLAKVVGGHLGRRLITLETGHFGLAPNTVKRGDGVYVLLGCSTPVVLRSLTGTSHFEVVGECYVEGFARGEAIEGLDDGRYRLEEINLC